MQASDPERRDAQKTDEPTDGVQMPEPWLRGPLAGVHPLVMPVFFSYQMVREDLMRYVLPLKADQIWCDIQGATIGFHLKHIAGSVDRITTYLTRGTLTGSQLQALASERQGREAADVLYLQLDESLRDSESRLRTIDPAALYEARTVGRKGLPTTVVGLIVHLAEHTQRHLGQVITLCKAVRLAG